MAALRSTLDSPHRPHARPSTDLHAMAKIHELADRVERLLLRHEELQRTNALLLQQVTTVTQERDSLRSRLSAARQRVDALLLRLPTQAPASEGADAAAQPTEGSSS